MDASHIEASEGNSFSLRLLAARALALHLSDQLQQYLFLTNISNYSDAGFLEEIMCVASCLKSALRGSVLILNFSQFET
jgi:hypothetical protein